MTQLSLLIYVYRIFNFRYVVVCYTGGEHLETNLITWGQKQGDRNEDRTGDRKICVVWFNSNTKQHRKLATILRENSSETKVKICILS